MGSKPEQDDVPEPIAIIGMSCRFSGMASNQHGFWQLLSKGLTTWSNNAKDRFRMKSFWHPEALLPGSTNCQGMHLLTEDPALFDNDFFQISSLEAKAIDPQQRLILEVVYEAFENAGVSVEKMEGSNTGVYCASNHPEYDQILGRDPELSPTYRFTGTGANLMANRISYVFDLRGPSFVVDTACSSSFVALHDAVNALRSREIDQAIVGGCNILLDPDMFAIQSSMTFLSPHGRCYSFDARANGYGRGDGAVALLLKPLAAAIRDGDTVRGVVRGTALGSDGKTFGITMPSSHAQYETICRAYASARLDPAETIFVEAHGTGTTAGDGAEVAAFTKAFCARRPASKKLYIGSVKSNIGHTEHTSGIAGLVKALLMLENGLLVPNPTFKTPNPALGLEKAGIEVVTKVIPWPEGEVRRISINSSGYGGTNAHVIIEAGDVWHKRPIEMLKTNDISIENEAEPKIFCFTHQRQQAIYKMAALWRRFLSSPQSLSLNSLAYTLGSRRSMHSYRAVVVANSLDTLIEGLRRLEKGSHRPIKAYINPKLCFVFTGQGAQWAQMARELLSFYPLFKKSLQRAEKDLLNFGATWRLVEELEKPTETSRINEAELAQPCTTAVQVALVDLLASFGARPSQLCGHSSGEIPAAYALGALSATDAMRIAYFRGMAVSHLRKVAPHLEGAMLAVGLSESEARRYLTDYGSRIVAVACINSSNSVTLSGESSALDELSRDFEAANIFNRKLAVNVAYHSPHMKYVEEFYHKSIKDIRPKPSRSGLQMVSSVTGEFIQGEELGAEYWVQNLISPVRFSDSLAKVLRLSRTEGSLRSEGLIIEIGPHSALRGPVNQTVKDLALTNVHYLGSLSQRKSDTTAILTLMGEMFSRGVNVFMDQVNKVGNRRNAHILTNLPSYNWYHEVGHWNESRRSQNYRFKKFPRHELLGTLAPDSISTQPSWHNYIRLADTPWLTGYCIDGSHVFSASGYLAMVVESLRQQFAIGNRSWKSKTITMKKVAFTTPLLLTADPIGVEVILQLTPYSSSAGDERSNWQEFRIFSVSAENESTVHCHGTVDVVDSPQGPPNRWQQSRDDQPWARINPSRIYKELNRVGIQYTGSYLCMESIAARPWETEVSLSSPDVKPSMPSAQQQTHAIHSTIIEGFFQATFAGLQQAGCLDETMIPASIDEVQLPTDCIPRLDAKLVVKTKSAKHGLARYTSDIWVTRENEANDNSVFMVKGLKFVVQRGRKTETPRRPLCYYNKWQLDPHSSSSDSIVAYCSKDLGEENQRLREFATAFSRRSIKEALDALTPEEEATVSGFRKYYLSWMRAQDIVGDEIIIPELEKKLSALGAYGEAVVRIGCCLKSIVTGEIDGLSLLMQENLLYRIYIEREGINRCHKQLANYIKLAKFKNPGLKVLEIGGGTGSLTLPLLEALYGESNSYGRATEKYVFTDVSKGFLALMRDKLGKFESFVELETLDIEQSASEQGFELGSFDIIVSSNVIHATKNLKATLANLKSLLKPGGQLAMTEFTVPTIHGGMVWGVLAGWWFGVEEGRSSWPLLEPPVWDKILKENEFSGVDLHMRDYDHEEHELSFLLSSATIETAPSEKEVVSIIAAEGNIILADQLADTLSSHFEEAQVSLISKLAIKEASGTIIMLPGVWQDASTEACQNNWTQIGDELKKAQKVLWVNASTVSDRLSPQSILINSLARSLRTEKQGPEFYTLNIDAESNLDSKMISCVVQMYTKVLGPHASPMSEREWEFAARGGELCIPRIVPDMSASDWVTDTVSSYHPRLEQNVDLERPLQLSIRSAGLWDTLYWRDHPGGSISTLRPTEISIRVDHAALNFRDVMFGMDQISDSGSLLIEGTGTVIAVGEESSTRFSVGDAVCFLEPAGLGTVSNVNRNLVCRIPQGMTMTTAAAIPVAYATALYSLKGVANLQPGERILIHLGSGGVGQATIAVARYLGCNEIFVTVGSDEKRNLIKKQFGISNDHIFSSRDLAFGDGILKATHGHGVDVVFNSLSGEAAAVGCQVLAPFGRFIDVSKTGVEDSARLQTQLLKGNKTFSVVDMILLAKSKPTVLQELVKTSLDLIQDGKLQMIHPITVGHVGTIRGHFERMQAGKHVGKLVVKVDGTQSLKVQPKRPTSPTLDPKATYVVVGGIGGLVREMIRHLAQLGAKKIIALCCLRSGTPTIEETIKEMKTFGVNLVIIKGGVGDRGIVELLKENSVDTPIKGIIYSNTNLKYLPSKAIHHHHSQQQDSISIRMAGMVNFVDSFITSRELEFFILLGSYDESTFSKSLAHHYASRGLPFRALDLGDIDDLGFAENEEITSNFLKRGLKPIKIAEALAALNYAIANPLANAPDEAQITVGIYNGHTVDEAMKRLDSRFSHIWSYQSKKGQPETSKGPNITAFDVQIALQEAKTPEEAVQAAFIGLKDKVVLTLGIQAEDFHTDRSVMSYGMDSLIELQLRNWITGHLGAPVSRVELMSTLSMMELASMAARRSRLVRAEVFASSDGQEI